jgi:hypothetical protein
MIKNIAKALPHFALLRGYHHIHLHEELYRARRASEILGIPLFSRLNASKIKHSDTVFVLGSGSSINSISVKHWAVIRNHDSIGFNFWPAHDFVPDIFVFESIGYDDQPVAYDALRNLIEKRASHYSNVVKLITDVRVDSYRRQLIFDMPNKFRENLYVGYTTPVIARTEVELEAGLKYLRSSKAFVRSNQIPWLFKYGGSVVAVLSLAVRMNYRRIVLCGIDLGNQDYFYHCRERFPDYAHWEFSPKTERHLTTRRLPWMVPAAEVVFLFKKIILDPLGIELFVENTSSALYPTVPHIPATLFENNYALGK